nr:sodium/glucose cotransporter 2-like isoform X2 [Microcebus murinus]
MPCGSRRSLSCCACSAASLAAGNAAMDHSGSGFASNWSTEGLGIHDTLDSLVLALYLLSVLSVGLWAMLSSSRGTVTDFFLAGRNLAWWLHPVPQEML